MTIRLTITRARLLTRYCTGTPTQNQRRMATMCATSAMERARKRSASPQRKSSPIHLMSRQVVHQDDRDQERQADDRLVRVGVVVHSKEIVRVDSCRSSSVAEHLL